jgi:hypothetical protein
VINGAYYGNESWRPTFVNQRAASNMAGADPRAGAFAYGLDYDGADGCIDLSATGDGSGGRGQPTFSSSCLEQRAAMTDPAVAAGAPGNANLPAFELAQQTMAPAPGSTPESTLRQAGADPRQDRLPWGGTHVVDPSAERSQLAPVPNELLAAGTPDPVDTILRTFRAYYPVNYPGSTVNQNFTFGSSILPDTAKFHTNDPFGRGHSSGCSACHASYRYDGSRDPTPVVHDDGTVELVVDPTTKHRELDPATQDEQQIAGTDQLVGRAVNAAQQAATGRAQQKTYAADHVMSAAVTTDQCGLCHGFVTRINYAYQGMAEEEQRDALARRAPIAMTTPKGTSVRILDSWVREEHAADGSLVAVRHGDPQAEALGVIAAAKARDAMLAAQGFVAGNGGCAPNVFTEDCNNNGELDHQLVLTRTDSDGTTHTTTIDEDANGNGALDLIDRVPREMSVDGRQLRYVYGGRNGSTRLMDVHFERGMQCIDCHFLQDVHGDGHLYSTNWDHIEIECEDCHGAAGRGSLVTTGPNGGNDLTKARDRNGVPYFQIVDGKVTQRSRVTPGVTWTVPQTADVTTGLAKEAHSDKHLAAPGQGSTFGRLDVPVGTRRLRPSERRLLAADPADGQPRDDRQHGPGLGRHRDAGDPGVPRGRGCLARDALARHAERLLHDRFRQRPARVSDQRVLRPAAVLDHHRGALAAGAVVGVSRRCGRVLRDRRRGRLDRRDPALSRRRHRRARADPADVARAVPARRRAAARRQPGQPGHPAHSRGLCVVLLRNRTNR